MHCRKQGSLLLATLLLCLAGWVQPLNALPTEGKFLFEFGSVEAGNGQFNAPCGIAVNEHEEIIVVDSLNKRVQVFDRCGNFLFGFGEAGAENGNFENPFGVAVTEDNCIVVTDSHNNNIQVFDRCSVQWANTSHLIGERGLDIY